MPKQCYLSELHQQLEKVVKSNPTSRATVMEDEAEDPKVKIAYLIQRFLKKQIDIKKGIVNKRRLIEIDLFLVISNVLGEQVGRLFRQIWIWLCPL